MPLWRPRVLRRDKPVPGRVQAAASGEDSLLAAVAKWIPVEVVTVYKAAMGIIPDSRYSIRLGFTIFSIIISAFWIAFATKPEGGKIAWRQALLAPAAFTCWAVATQTDLMKNLYPSWESWMAFLVLAVGTLLLPIFDGILKFLGVTQN